MKAFANKPLIKKYGKKALILYLGWCLVKGLVFLFLGFKLLN